MARVKDKGQFARWMGGEERYIVTVEIATKGNHLIDNDDKREEALSALDLAIEEGLGHCLQTQGIQFIGMSKPTTLDLRDWTMTS